MTRVTQQRATRSSWRRRAGALGLAAAGVGMALAVPSSASSTEVPIHVLVFSQPYGFAHTSIGTGSKYFQTLNDGVRYTFHDTKDPNELIRQIDTGTYDELVWNNSTGNVPLTDAQKTDLLNWVRAGHGFVGIHSSGDSNYSWPEFSEVAGGLYLAHIYKFGGGGLTPDPTNLGVVRDDPNSPLLAGIPTDFQDLDETYRWQMDPRTDVHVLLSIDNTTVYEGEAYHFHSPIVWCRPFGLGRTWYTNLGHGEWEYQNPGFLTMLSHALQYAGGRLDANCSVPTDPYTGVDGAGRLEGVWADTVTGASPQYSTYSGGMAVLTNIVPGATVTYKNVDLTGVKNISLFAAAQTITAPNNTEGVGLVGSPNQQRITPTAGGTIEIHADSATGPLLGSALLVNPGPAEHLNVPDQVAAANGVLGQTSWSLLTPSGFTPATGVHNVVLVFTSPAGAPTGDIGSFGWMHLVH
jgi:type 1 glutamine amidotransferase